MPWTTGSLEHIRHIRDLEQMMLSSAGREYSIGNEPDGFKEYWDSIFAELYVVSCLIYLEHVFGTDKHWLSSSNIQSYPFLLRILESLRCVRNCIVHNGGMLNRNSSAQAQIILDYDRDVRNGLIVEEIQNIGDVVEPYYIIEPNGRINVDNSFAAVRWTTIQYLMIEGVVQQTNGG